MDRGERWCLKHQEDDCPSSAAAAAATTSSSTAATTTTEMSRKRRPEDGIPATASNRSGKKRKPRKKFIRKVNCRVCGDVANDHIHYGGVACYSCRAFFRRSVSGTEHGAKYRCSRGNECPITKATRKQCQSCRYQKCLRTGMQPSWVMTEEEKTEKRDKALRRKMEVRRKLKKAASANPAKPPATKLKQEEEVKTEEDEEEDDPGHSEGASSTNPGVVLFPPRPHFSPQAASSTSSSPPCTPEWGGGVAFLWKHRQLLGEGEHERQQRGYRQQGEGGGHSYQQFMEDPRTEPLQHHSDPGDGTTYLPRQDRSERPPSRPVWRGELPHQRTSHEPDRTYHVRHKSHHYHRREVLEGEAVVHPLDLCDARRLPVPFFTEEARLLCSLALRESQVKRLLPVSAATMGTLLGAARSGRPLPYGACAEGLSVCLRRIESFAAGLEPFATRISREDCRRLLGANVHAAVSIKTALLLRPGNSLRGQIRCATGEDLGSGSGSAVPSNGIRQLVAFSAQLMSPPQPELQAQPSTAVEAEAVLKWQERGAGRGGERTESSSEKRIQYSQIFRSPWCCTEEHETKFRSLMEELFTLDMDEVSAALLAIIALLSPPTASPSHQRPRRGSTSQQMSEDDDDKGASLLLSSSLTHEDVDQVLPSDDDDNCGGGGGSGGGGGGGNGDATVDSLFASSSSSSCPDLPSAPALSSASAWRVSYCRLLHRYLSARLASPEEVAETYLAYQRVLGRLADMAGILERQTLRL